MKTWSRDTRLVTATGSGSPLTQVLFLLWRRPRPVSGRITHRLMWGQAFIRVTLNQWMLWVTPQCAVGGYTVLLKIHTMHGLLYLRMYPYLEKDLYKEIKVSWGYQGKPWSSMTGLLMKSFGHRLGQRELVWGTCTRPGVQPSAGACRAAALTSPMQWGTAASTDWVPSMCC